MKRHMPEIGSDFWEWQCSSDTKEFNRKNNNGILSQTSLFVSGRNAIKAFCREMAVGKTVRRKVVLLPEYTCESVIQPFVEEGWLCTFYPVRRDFTIDWNICRVLLEKVDAEVFYLQSYFGFPTLSGTENIIEWCKEKEIVTIEDVTHSIFDKSKWTNADWHTASLHKWMAVPDGGMLMGKELQYVEMFPADSEIVVVAKKAWNTKKQYIESGGENPEQKRYYKQLYTEWLEKVEQNEMFYEMSNEAIEIWENLDKAFLIEQRRKNYRTLYAYLKTRKDIVIPFCEDVSDCVPMYFPIYAKNQEVRNELQRMLGDEAVYCPVIWPYSELVTELSTEGKYIYEHILCIPIDQRYQEQDMQDIIGVFEDINKYRK